MQVLRPAYRYSGQNSFTQFPNCSHLSAPVTLLYCVVPTLCANDISCFVTHSYICECSSLHVPLNIVAILSEPSPRSRTKRTLCRTAPLKELIVSKVTKKFPKFYGILSFINVLTTASHRSLSSVKWIQSRHFCPISLRFILTLILHPSCSYLRIFLQVFHMHFSFPVCAYLILLSLIILTLFSKVFLLRTPICAIFSYLHFTFSLLDTNSFLTTLFSNTIHLYKEDFFKVEDSRRKFLKWKLVASIPDCSLIHSQFRCSLFPVIDDSSMSKILMTKILRVANN
jgi:hypothetical protein